MSWRQTRPTIRSFSLRRIARSGARNRAACASCAPRATATYVFKNLRPGEYQIAAVADVEPGEWYDPAFLQRIAPSATAVTIAEGEKKAQDIRIGGG